MAYQKDSRKGGPGKDGRSFTQSGYKGGAGKTQDGYRKTTGAKPQGQYGKPQGQYGKPQGQYGKPQGQYGKPRYDRRDEVFDGASTRPQKQKGPGDAFFNRNQGGPSGPRMGGMADVRRPGNAPRRATPTGRPVPPAVRDDAMQQGRPSAPRPQQRSFEPRPYAPKPNFEPRPRPEPKPGFEPRRPQYEQPVFEEQTEVAFQENILAGRNPIREAIKAGRSIDKLLVAEGDLSGSARQIVAWAREAHIVVQYVDRVRLDQIYPNHQGMIAFAAAAEYKTVEDILSYAKEKGEQPFIVALDGITDPHNLGAIIRTAECAGAHGVIIPERRSALLSPAAVKASAGACEHLRVAKVVNLGRTLGDLKDEGVWIIGADAEGEPAFGADLSGPACLVIGSEGEGISALIKRQCDKVVALPMKGKIDSLNASVAAGVLMYAVLRARGK